ncbi:unnamed protein product [Ambrosiozyma monospora]|uniref:Unnamed protein product n=1 Tax=Ambrosiozyma monospora TaxID=43982 RepID=A0A9W6Z221_AMBMO|nr:unnamed protein product [Ambrosiozyma monospora]
MSILPIQQLKGFYVLPITLPSPTSTTTTSSPSKKHSSKDSQVIHYMFIKKHVTKNEQESHSRSLFLVNVPVDANFNNIKKLFSQFSTGAIIESFKFNPYYDYNKLVNYNDEIDFTALSNPEFKPEPQTQQQQHQGKKGKNQNQNQNQQQNRSHCPVGCAIVTFLDKQACNLALSNVKKLIGSSSLKKHIPSWTTATEDNNSIPISGLKKYTASRKLDPKQLSLQVAQAMQEFTEREHRAAEEVEEMRELVDEDGFTLVVGSHRKTKNSILGGLKKKSDLLADAGKVKKMKKKEKQDFYRFQIRERKKMEMSELLKKFKEDQERVKVMKEKRKFKPY